MPNPPVPGGPNHHPEHVRATFLHLEMLRTWELAFIWAFNWKSNILPRKLLSSCKEQGVKDL